MNDATGELEYDPDSAPKAAEAISNQPKTLAPKANPIAKLPLEEITGSNENQPQQQLRPLTSPQFTFINTTNGVQYGGPGSRGVARSHVMRDYHRRKGKDRSRLKHERLAGPSSSRHFVTIAPLHGHSSSKNSSVRLNEIGDDELHRQDESITRTLPHTGKESGAGNNSALSLHQPHGQVPRKGRGGLPMGNLWALPIHAHAAELLSHYIQTFARTFFPVKRAWESEWFTNALSDPACFHGTLFLSVAHKALLSGTGGALLVECFQHRGEAIKIINERLNDPTRRVTDGTIAAIGCLAAFETLCGTVTAATVHVDGLQKLVALRGGLSRLGMDGFLGEFLCWVDLSNATALREQPHFRPFDTSPVCPKDSDFEALWKYTDAQWNACAPPISVPHKTYQGLDDVEARLFHQLRQLIHTAATARSTPSSTQSTSFPSSPTPSSNKPSSQHAQSTASAAYTTLILTLERQISLAVQERLRFRARFGAPSYSRPPTCLFYIPALITCYLHLRQPALPARASIYGPLVARMRRHIEECLTPERFFDRFLPEFWLWALVVVGAAAVGVGKKGEEEQRQRTMHLAYFQRLVRQLCRVLGVCGWDAAKVVLREFAWADEVCERSCKVFWDTLEDAALGTGVEVEVDLSEHVQNRLNAL